VAGPWLVSSSADAHGEPHYGRFRGCLWQPLTGMRSIRRRLMPMVMVVSELGQLPQAPCNRSFTTSPSISTNSTLPPSAMRYGRTCTVQQFSAELYEARAYVEFLRSMEAVPSAWQRMSEMRQMNAYPPHLALSPRLPLSAPVCPLMQLEQHLRQALAKLSIPSATHLLLKIQIRT
jgi:hypothetical protein